MVSTVTVGILALPGRDPDLPLPDYATPGAAGMDICANLAPRDRATGLALAPGARALVPTGIAVEVPPGYEIQVRPRSGMALRDGVTLVNSPGTIDSDYRGEVGLIVINHGSKTVMLSHGTRMAQLVLAQVSRIAWRVAEGLAPSERGAGGFGSTGLRAGETP